MDRLDLAEATGAWLVQSASPTIYLLDLDAWAMLRLAQEGSTRGLGDGSWLRLDWVEARASEEPPIHGEIRTSTRTYWRWWETWGDGWWLQSPVLGIHRVVDEELLAPLLPRRRPLPSEQLDRIRAHVLAVRSR